jgi:hypothetical protein
VDRAFGCGWVIEQGPGKVLMGAHVLRALAAVEDQRPTWMDQGRSASVGGSKTGMTDSEDHQGSYAMLIVRSESCPHCHHR